MKTKIYIILFSLLTLHLSFLLAQEENTGGPKLNINKGNEKVNSTQTVGDTIAFKSGGVSIITITDEGSNAGSIRIPQGSTPSTTDNKLYNVGGILKFNGADIGSTGSSSGGWTKSGTNIYNTTLTDNVGIGTNNPLSLLSVGAPGTSDIGIFGNAPTSLGTGIFGSSIAGTGATGFVNSGIGVQGEVNLGTAIKGIVNDYSIVNNKAGFFELRTGPGYAVYGIASGLGLYRNYGGYFEAKADSGIGIYGIASGSGINSRNFGGYFEALGVNGRGIFAFSSGNNSRAVVGKTSGGSSRAVYGSASDEDDNSLNYGGYFEAAGGKGYGVYGHASNATVSQGANTTYGGYFISESPRGIGVYGHAATENVIGITDSYGGYFIAEDGNGVYGQTNGTAGELAGVYGISSNVNAIFTYGGYFISNGSNGSGVYGEADGINAIGVTGSSDGTNGIGLFGRGSGTNGIGVKGYGSVGGTSYDFDAQGPGVNYGATSSIRWKKNIVEIQNPLNKLSNLRGVYFDWDEEHGGGKDIGCIAEEVGKVLPEIVVYEKNGVDADGMDYSKLTPLLIEVAKAQQKIIEDLTTRLNVLENAQ